jgi:hypothetical protein
MKIRRAVAHLQSILKKEGDIEAVIEVYNEEEKTFKIVPMEEISVETREEHNRSACFLQ